MKSIKLFVSLILFACSVKIACMDKRNLDQYGLYLARALPEAIREGKLEQAKKLISKGAELESDEVLDALWDAAEDGHQETVRFLLDEKLHYLLTQATPNKVIRLALRSRHIVAVQKLLEAHKKLKIELDTIKTVLSVLVTLTGQLQSAQKDAQKKEEACKAYQAGTQELGDQETDGLVDLLEGYTPYKELKKAEKNAKRRVAGYTVEIAKLEEIFDLFLMNQHDLVQEEDKNGETLLDHAISLETLHYVELLREKYKAKATIAGIYSVLSPTYESLSHESLLGFFFANQPDLVDAQDRNGQTLLDYVVENRQVRFVDLLLWHKAKATVSSLYSVFNSLKTDRTVNSESQTVESNEHDEIFVLLVSHLPDLINQQDNRGKTLLYHAIEKGFVAYTRLLLEYGAEVNMLNLENASPLHVAVSHLKTELMFNKMFFNDKQAKALFNVRKDIVQLLLEAGADYSSLEFDNNEVRNTVKELYDKAKAFPSLKRVITQTQPSEPKRVPKQVLIKNKFERKGTIRFSVNEIYQAAKKGKRDAVKALLQEQNINFEKLLDNQEESKQERKKLYKLIELLETGSQHNGRRYNFHRKRTGGIQELISMLIENNPDMFDEQNLSINGHQLWDLIKVDRRMDIMEILRKRFGREVTTIDAEENTLSEGDGEEIEVEEAVSNNTQEIEELLVRHGAQSGILLNTKGRMRREHKSVSFSPDLTSVFSVTELLTI